MSQGTATFSKVNHPFFCKYFQTRRNEDISKVIEECLKHED